MSPPLESPMILPYPNLAASSIERFRFPELPESPTPSPKPAPFEQSPPPSLPKVVWPQGVDTETTRACAGIADTMLRQLSLDHPTVVAFTSPGDGDGKTSLLVALAPQLAKRIASNVLVVDANLRRPDLTAQLNLPLVEAAARSMPIYPTDLPRLSVLPAIPSWDSRTTAVLGATERLSPQQMGTPYQGFSCPWIEKLREWWPLVLLDMASLGNPEAAPMVQCCDGVYLVVRLGYTARRAVAEAAHLIRHSGGRLLGCVVVE